MEIKEALQKNIYSPWAFTEDEEEKSKSNREVYRTIKHLAKVECIGVGYAHRKYKVTETTDIKLTTAQKALIADEGNLCFGYRTEGSIIVIHTD